MSKPQAPPAPNLTGAATQQGTANLDAAKAMNIMSNPNIVSPYGNQTVSWGNPGSSAATGATPATDLSPKDVNFQYLNPQGIYGSQTINLSPSQLSGQAPQALQDLLSQNNHIQALINGTPYNMGGMAQGGNLWTPASGGTANSLYNLIFGGTPGTSENPGTATFDSNGNPILQPTITQTLSPLAQGALNQQQQAELGLSTLANTQTANIGNQLATPFSFSGSPQTNLGQTVNPSAAGIATPLSPDKFQQTYGAGSQYANPASTPNLFSFGSATGGVNAPNLQTSLNTAGVNPVNQGFNPSQYGQAQGINTSGVAPMPVSPGMTGQQAIMSRLQPNLDQARQSEINRLTQQGLVPGGEAYNNDMRVFNQGQNDAQTQAILQGLGLDMSANQQGFGEAQAQSQAQNQAIAQNAGLGLTAAGFGNQGQQQAFNEAVQSGQFGNQAQLASFGAGLQNQGASNSAIQQNQQTALAQQNAYNQAIAQGFSQAQAMQAAQNSAVQQNFSNYGTQNQLQNQSQQQLYNEQLQSGQFGNTAQAQAYQQAFQNYNAPINAVTALLSGGQIQTPQFQGYSGANVAPAPILQGAQAQNQALQQTYAQQVAQHNALLGGLGSLGGSLLSGGLFSFGGSPTQSFGY